ncbi:MAG: hypothetical protein FWG97_01630 [Deltaproteobacteria bacterium]|nr:hypothetical protein [Deltaproteobacteria bacterium]
MTQTNSVSPVSSTNFSTGDPSSVSLQLRFAQLQMALAETAKQGALDYMDEIEKIQKEQQEVADMLNQARQLQANAKSGGDKAKTTMPPEMAAYMDANGLAYDKTGGDLDMTADEWEVAITSLKAQQDQLGTNTQQMMVYIQDFMGQYNSYLQGANSSVQQSNQTLAELARLR